jgi:hypothetical protein
LVAKVVEENDKGEEGDYESFGDPSTKRAYPEKCRLANFYHLVDDHHFGCLNFDTMTKQSYGHGCQATRYK